MIIDDFPAPVLVLNYTDSQCHGKKLVTGDLRGNVAVLEFSDDFLKYFRSGIALYEHIYSNVVKVL